jgi:hypothetical protein
LTSIQSQEHHHNWDCLLASNQIADEIGEAPIGLLLVPAEYQLDSDRYLIKIEIISKLILSVARKWILVIHDVVGFS